MAVSVPLWLLITLISSPLVLAVCAIAFWAKASRSTPRKRQPESPPQTVSSASPSELASLQADQAALYSTLEKLTTTVKRLSSRQGMRDVRARNGADSSPPPTGASKRDLLRYYGMSGKVGPEFARAQLQREQQLDAFDTDDQEPN